MKKILLILGLFTSSFLLAQNNTTESTEIAKQQNPNQILISEGTLVKASLKNEIRGGKMQVGDQIEFSLAQPIVVDDQVVIGPGAKIIGSVTEARASGIVGRKGKLAFDIQYLYLDNGQVIKLTGESAKNLKGSGALVAATAVVLTPLGLFIPGKGAKFEAGTVFDAYIAKDTILRQK